jgi:hypothetical protein
MRFFFILLSIINALSNCKTTTKNERQDSFEGIIEYAYTYQSDSINIDSLKTNRPSSGQMVYKDSLYKSVFIGFIGKNTESYIYDNHTGIAFHLSISSDSIDCEDYTAQNDTVFSYQIIETGEKILGEEVNILEFVSKYATQRFYYSLKHKVAPFNYDKHLAYNWNFYKEKTNGGVLLKVEHIFKKFTMIGIATKIEAKEISIKEFRFDLNKLKAACR